MWLRCQGACLKYLTSSVAADRVDIAAQNAAREIGRGEHAAAGGGLIGWFTVL